jgi:hypothetical protein
MDAISCHMTAIYHCILRTMHAGKFFVPSGYLIML